MTIDIKLDDEIILLLTELSQAAMNAGNVMLEKAKKEHSSELAACSLVFSTFASEVTKVARARLEKMRMKVHNQ